jgi:HK97 family phage major capsid protein
MPYHLEGNCVYKDGESEAIKCHDTEQEAKDHIAALYAAKDDEKSIEFVNFGQVVKALPDGKIGGYLVTYGGLDMTGDYFDAKTDFGEYSKLPVLYHHGFDATLKKRRIGTAEVRQDDVGLWAEAQLSMRDDYEKMVYELAQNGKLGWSSGAAGHVTDREADAKGMHITQWYMAEASLTPRPAEPRNSVTTLKAYLSDNTPAENKPEGDPETVKAVESEGVQEAESIQPIVVQENVKMEITPELQALLDAGAENAVKKFRESEPATKSANIVVTKDEADNPFKDVSEFFQAVKVAGMFPSQSDPRLLPLKATGMNEAIPSQGGFLVPQTTAAGIIEKMYDTGTLLTQFPRDAVAGNGMTYNVVDETSRANGSRFGGITGYWLAEAATKTASKPAFRQLELKLKKVAAVCVATDELLEDAGALQSWLMRTVPLELKFKVEDSIINGTGAGMPYGILPSPALKTVTRINATSITAVDVGNMWSSRYAGANDYIWVASPSIFPQLMNMSIGNFPVFVGAGGLSGLPYGSLLGRPMYETEYNPTLGEVGDLLLVSPSAYPMIEKSGGIQAASSIHVYFLQDESAFRFVYRVDGSPSWRTTLTKYDGNTVSPFVALTTST